MTIIVTGGAGVIGSNFVFHMLNKYPDYAYSPEHVFYTIDMWLNRSYREDGLGSLFYIPGATDIPNIDIWMAAHRYLMKIANGVR